MPLVSVWSLTGRVQETLTRRPPHICHWGKDAGGGSHWLLLCDWRGCFGLQWSVRISLVTNGKLWESWHRADSYTMTGTLALPPPPHGWDIRWQYSCLPLQSMTQSHGGGCRLLEIKPAFNSTSGFQLLLWNLRRVVQQPVVQVPQSWRLEKQKDCTFTLRCYDFWRPTWQPKPLKLIFPCLNRFTGLAMQSNVLTAYDCMFWIETCLIGNSQTAFVFEILARLGYC